MEIFHEGVHYKRIIKNKSTTFFFSSENQIVKGSNKEMKIETLKELHLSQKYCGNNFTYNWNSFDLDQQSIFAILKIKFDNENFVIENTKK